MHLRQPITDLSTLIRKGELSPVTLVERCLDRISAVDSTLHAYITVNAEAALEQAHFAVKEIRANRYIGPLHGIPIAHKDNVATAGIRTTAHSKLLEQWVPTRNATVVDRLAQAGAISLGKLAMHEFALTAPGHDVAFPAACNPWDVLRSPGGSSSGSGVAVTSGMALAATGSDSGGSIRHPAFACGIVGMKPTFGRVSLAGVIPLASSVDHVGPLTLTVRDNAAMLQAMSEPEYEGHPGVSDLIGVSVRGLSLGVPRGLFDDYAYDAEVLLAFERACDVFRQLGIRIIEIDLSISECNEYGRVLMGHEAYLYHREHLVRSPWGYSEAMRTTLAGFGRINRAQLAQARAGTEQSVQALNSIFRSGIDAIITPGREVLADLLSGEGCRPPAGRSYRLYSVAGCPALMVPAGYSVCGLPIGIQLAASAWREHALYQIAAAYEDVTQWWRREPPVLRPCS